jgi:acyl-CoA synthetase (AMP-forming)/AMP-acid ligase II
MTYAEMFGASAAARPDHAALVFPGAVITYAELWERAGRRARQLRALGVERGDTFGLMLPNSPQFVELFLAAARLGAVAVPVNVRHKTFEVAHLCRDGDLRVLATTSQAAEQLSLGRVVSGALGGLQSADPSQPLALDEFPRLRHVVMLGPTADAGMVDEPTLCELALSVPAEHPVGARPEDPVMIMYTSGTTSKAKGCVFTNDALAANAVGTAERFEMTARDRCWSPLPMYHVAALLFMSAIFSRGGTFISQEHFEPGQAVALFEEQRPTLLYPLFPAITLDLMHHPDFPSYDRQDVRAICNVSPPSTQELVQEAFAPAVLVNAYGMTEVCGTLSYSRLGDSHATRMGTCGPVLPGWEAAVVDPSTGERLPPGSKGELVTRGRSLFSGYYKNPEQTGASRDAEGFFRTGDLCLMDRDGYISFHGRLRDVLKVGGESVSAHEVEAYLDSHPSIKMSQIVGIPDGRLTEVPVAFVEVVPGATLEEEDVVAYCRGAIASFKVPRHVRFVTDWPMSSTKVQKFRLREQILHELGVEG